MRTMLGAMGRERFQIEFGHYSDWLVEACVALRADAIPAVSRGTGKPALLERAAGPLAASPGKLILDLGCGLGGPGAWLARHSGARVIGVDVMVESIRGLRRLFSDFTGVVASMRALPLADGTFDAAWSLGVLEMVADKPGATREMSRVLRAGAPLVIYDFVLSGTPSGNVPEADRFSRPDDTLRCLEEAGFAIREASPLPDLPPIPPDWAEARDSVRAEVRARHGDDERFLIVEEELRAFRGLVAQGTIEEWMFVAAKEEQ